MEQYNIDKFNKALLANDQVVFCVSDDHRLADKEVVTTKEMSKESLIFFTLRNGRLHSGYRHAQQPDLYDFAVSKDL